MGFGGALNSVYRTQYLRQQVGFRVVCEFPADVRLPPESKKPEPLPVAPEPRPVVHARIG